MIITILFALLGVLTLVFIATWFGAAREDVAAGRAGAGGVAPSVGHLLIGFVANFLDTLGIGSFATTTSIWRPRRLVPDEDIPGTLNVGHTLPTITEAFIYIAIIEVNPVSLVLLIAAAVAGAWLGAGVVAHWNRRRIQVGLGLVLIGAAGLMLMTQLNLFPLGGNVLGLTGVKLGVGLAGSFVLGAFMTLGLGFYAPCMILISLLGMNPKAAFPIMMGACAFLMPVASMRFVRLRRYRLRAALGLALGGIPGVLLAAYIVKELPLGAVRWLVIVVVVYTAISLLRSAVVERNAASGQATAS
jgi:uncharacterized membrane protein YfcA